MKPLLLAITIISEAHRARIAEHFDLADQERERFRIGQQTGSGFDDNSFTG